MLIIIPVSLGELLDKISILIIKEKNIIDKKKTNLYQGRIKKSFRKLRKNNTKIAS